MSIVNIQRARRNTPATTFSICGVHIYFSYDTPVGCNPPNAPSFQRENEWGPTTGRHLNEWGFNTPGIEKLDRQEFERRMELAIYEAMANRMSARLGEPA
jgi:hypothetical protein